MSQKDVNARWQLDSVGYIAYNYIPTTLDACLSHVLVFSESDHYQNVQFLVKFQGTSPFSQYPFVILFISLFDCASVCLSHLRQVFFPVLGNNPYPSVFGNFSGVLLPFGMKFRWCFESAEFSALCSSFSTVKQCLCVQGTDACN